MFGRYQTPPLFKDVPGGHTVGGQTVGGQDTSIDIFVDINSAGTDFILRDTNIGTTPPIEEELRILDKPEMSADPTRSSSTTLLVLPALEEKYVDRRIPNILNSTRSCGMLGGKTKLEGRSEQEDAFSPLQEVIDNESDYHGQLYPLRLEESITQQGSKAASNAAVGEGERTVHFNDAPRVSNPESVSSNYDSASPYNDSSHCSCLKDLQPSLLSDPPPHIEGVSPAVESLRCLPFQHTLPQARQAKNLDVTLASYTTLLERQLISERLYHASHHNYLFLQPPAGTTGNGMFHSPLQHAAVNPPLLMAPNHLSPHHIIRQLGSAGLNPTTTILLEAQSVHLLQQQILLAGFLPPSNREDNDSEPLTLPSTSGRRRSQYVIRPGAIISRDEIAEVDVLLERGAKGNRHKGSQHYRRLTNERRPLYQELPSRGAKKIMVVALATTLKESGARFIQKKEGQYIVMTDQEVRNKISQALREKRERTMLGGGDD